MPAGQPVVSAAIVARKKAMLDAGLRPEDKACMLEYCLLCLAEDQKLDLTVAQLEKLSAVSTGLKSLAGLLLRDYGTLFQEYEGRKFVMAARPILNGILQTFHVSGEPGSVGEEAAGEIPGAKVMGQLHALADSVEEENAEDQDSIRFFRSILIALCQHAKMYQQVGAGATELQRTGWQLLGLLSRSDYILRLDEESALQLLRTVEATKQHLGDLEHCADSVACEILQNVEDVRSNVQQLHVIRLHEQRAAEQRDEQQRRSLRQMYQRARSACAEEHAQSLQREKQEAAARQMKERDKQLEEMKQQLRKAQQDCQGAEQAQEAAEQAQADAEREARRVDEEVAELKRKEHESADPVADGRGVAGNYRQDGRAA